jgi:hypothetical protein
MPDLTPVLAATRRRSAMARYYMLAKAEAVTPYSSGFPWPYEVAVCFDPARYPVAISEGVAHRAVAITVTAADALKDQLKAHFAKSQDEWLLPIIHRMASGDTVTAEEAIAAYRNIHGQNPTSYEADI